jgi:hypothetical protein
MPIESEASYVARMVAESLTHDRNLDKAPLGERKAYRDAFALAMRVTPRIIAERIDWLLNGTYGRGEFERAWLVMTAGHGTNVQAQLVALIGAMEWSCPYRHTREAWKMLSDAQKKALSATLETVIKRNLAKRAAGEV